MAERSKLLLAICNWLGYNIYRAPPLGVCLESRGLAAGPVPFLFVGLVPRLTLAPGHLDVGVEREDVG
jgi:hypothetical protein